MATHSSIKVKSLSRVRLSAAPWTVAHQAPLSVGFSRKEHWSGLPFPSPADLPDPGIEPGSPALQADALLSEPPGPILHQSWGLGCLNFIVTKETGTNSVASFYDPEPSPSISLIWWQTTQAGLEPPRALVHDDSEQCLHH